MGLTTLLFIMIATVSHMKFSTTAIRIRVMKTTIIASH